MKTGKKLIGLILVLVMILSLVSVQAFAQEAVPEIPELQISRINPNAPEELTGNLPAWGTATSVQPRANTNYTDAYGAGISLRDAMIARKEQFTIHYKMFYNPDWSDEIFAENLNTTLNNAVEVALGESSNPKGGDYLGFHFIEVGLTDLVADDLVNNYLYLTASFYASYYTTAAEEAAVNAAVEDLIVQLELGGKSDFETVKTVYDYMTENIVYDYAALTDPSDLLAFTTYGALIEGEAVCQGYASLFYRMMKELGVNVRIIPGIGFNGEEYELHAWNIVKLGDMYYNLDSTWDAILHQAGLEYEYFLRSSDHFPEHYRDETHDTAQFHSDYPMSVEDYPIPEDADRFAISFANMTLGNSLAMNFAFQQDYRQDWTGCYATIVKEYADGRGNKEVTIPYKQWGSANINGVMHFTLKFDGVAAKEMSDSVFVTIYDAEGNPISKIWEDSVRGYAMRTLENPFTSEESAIMVVDLLNYGAAAQQYFKYNTSDLANNQMLDQHKALATKSAPATDSRVMGINYQKSNLGLESQILMRMAFNQAPADAYATIEFTNHSGNKVFIKVASNEIQKSGSYSVIVIDEIVIADGRKPVTVTIYNADGTVFATGTDSLESYIARMSNADAVYEAILKFSDSAYNFFH